MHNISNEIIKNLLITQGLTDIQAAQKIGVSRMTISRRRKVIGLIPKPKRPKGYYDLTEDQESKLFLFYSQGKNDYQVAELMHLGRNRLKKWRDLKGIKSKSLKKGFGKEEAEDIKRRHLKGESFECIASDYGVTRSSASKLLKRFGIKYTIPLRKRPEGIMEYNLSPIQKSVLIGDMLGDGGLVASSKHSAYYQCGHHIKQREYVQWLYKIFEPLSCRYREFKVKDSRDLSIFREVVTMATWSNKELYYWFNIFYPSGYGNKILNPILIDFIDDISLAAWYMGDGYRDKDNGKIVVGKDNDLIPFITSLNVKYDTEIFYAKQYTYEWLIFIRKPEIFFKMIGPYITPDMTYKIPDKYKYLIKG